MKTIHILSYLLLFAFASGTAQAQNVVAEDHASNYTEQQFQDLENLGSGFGEWHREIDGEDAAVLLQSAADNGSNSAVIDTDGMSFALRSSEGDAADQRVDLGRVFAEPLQDGQVFSFQMAWNWASPGLTGFTLHNGSWDDPVMLLDFDSEGYFVNNDLAEEHASPEDWDEGDQWRGNGVALEVTITQNGDDLEYAVVAITEQSHVDFSGVIEGVTADRVNFFNDGRPNWGEGNPGQGSLFVNSLRIAGGEPTSVDQEPLARSFELEQNYPNPFNPATTISYRLDDASHISLSVYDVLGRKVQLLDEGVRSAGRHSVQFDAAELNSGIYLYRLETTAGAVTKTMMLVK
ncbi:T9SS type A sorting domain-containing protein [Balneolales bacterium ANBcel1]|nr:T9SS type A sorting domain-containing protein [Balneolales bacterium ANBcel1]